MARVQLALNVSDIAESVAFYSRLFGTAPSKRRPGYANFTIDDPPLKLVLIEGGGVPGTYNHLGVEVESRDGVTRARAHMAALGLPMRTEEGVDCCFAVQDKVWVEDPDGAPWEYYTVLSHTGADPATAAGAVPVECCAGRGGRMPTTVGRVRP